MGVTCDRVLIYDILRYTMNAAKILNIDENFQNDKTNNTHFLMVAVINYFSCPSTFLSVKLIV